MNKRRIVVSKINSIGSMSNVAIFSKNENRIDGGSINNAYCSIDHDNITTYVRSEYWDGKKYLYRPYVECGYVE
jgi:hypothetical protein